MRGNVIDMAVGIIIGAAFGKIVDSLVKDIIMPPIGLLIGSMDFSNLFFVLKDVPGHHGTYASLAQAVQAGAHYAERRQFSECGHQFYHCRFCRVFAD